MFGLESVPDLVIPSHEVSSARWIPASALASGEGTGEVLVRGQTLRTPGYRVGDELIWGMTHRIIRPFLRIVWD